MDEITTKNKLTLTKNNTAPLAKRIIPCLDIRDGRTVKGINFENIRDAGDPVELAQRYVKEGADELVFLDITATNEERKTFADLVLKIAKHINIPFTVGGGISSKADASRLLEAGADKVSINSSAVKNPGLVDELAKEFGSQFVVVAIDTKRESSKLESSDVRRESSVVSRELDESSSLKYETRQSALTLHDSRFTSHDIVHTHGGKKPTHLHTVAWAKEVYNRGAGEILLTSMNSDGTKNGFAIDITSQVCDAINIPVIASGGAGNMQHFVHVFEDGKADAALAASIFHFGEVPIPELKRYLNLNKISIRM